MQKMELKVGDVVQIRPDLEDSFFAGCFMYVTEPKSFGAQGFIAIPKERGKPVGEAYYRCSWEDMEYIGESPWIPAEEQ